MFLNAFLNSGTPFFLNLSPVSNILDLKRYHRVGVFKVACFFLRCLPLLLDSGNLLTKGLDPSANETDRI